MNPGLLVALAQPPTDNCVYWTGPLNRDGYGNCSGLSAHKVVYESLVGPVPAGLELDHLCRVRACVNPAHMEPVTHAENMRRSAPAQKRACANGHLYDAANTYIRTNGGRDCRACGRDRVRRYLARKAQAAA